jgi:hypothetical protein
MTKDEVLKLAKVWFEANTYGDEAVEVYEAIEQALAQPAPVQSCYCLNCEALSKELAALKAQPEERNFCPRCGKRTRDLTTIHTCTPPQENT